MSVWTKTTPSGQRVELRFRGHSIEIAIDGKHRGTTGKVFRLDAQLRSHLYRNAPLKNSRGEPITHAVDAVLLTATEGAEVERLHKAAKAEQAEQFERERREKYAAQLAEAAATGQPVVIESGMADCNDPKLECSQDFVEWCAMPDGTFRTFRTHTY